MAVSKRWLISWRKTNEASNRIFEMIAACFWIWNLSRALGLDMSELVEEFESSGSGAAKIEVLLAADTPRISNAQTRCTLSILGPHNQVGQFEWYDLEIEPGGILESQPHSQGTREHLTILQGAAEVTSGEQTIVLYKGDTGRYKADIPHAIRCEGKQPLRALLIVMG